MATSEKKAAFVDIITKEDSSTKGSMKENDHLGVYFLVNKDNIENEDYEEVNNSFPVLIPAKYHNHPNIVNAYNEQLENWEKYEAFIEVDETEAINTITTRWVITEKGDTEKARLCDTTS